MVYTTESRSDAAEFAEEVGSDAWGAVDPYTETTGEETFGSMKDVDDRENELRDEEDVINVKPVILSTGEMTSEQIDLATQGTDEDGIIHFDGYHVEPIPTDQYSQVTVAYRIVVTGGLDEINIDLAEIFEIMKNNDQMIEYSEISLANESGDDYEIADYSSSLEEEYGNNDPKDLKTLENGKDYGVFNGYVPDFNPEPFIEQMRLKYIQTIVAKFKVERASYFEVEYPGMGEVPKVVVNGTGFLPKQIEKPVDDPSTPEPAPVVEPVVDPEPAIEPVPTEEPVVDPAPVVEPVEEPVPVEDPAPAENPADQNDAQPEEPVADSEETSQAPAEEPESAPANAPEAVSASAPQAATVAAPAEVLGEVRETPVTAASSEVLGARRGSTEDTANTMSKLMIIILAALGCATATVLSVLSGKKA